MIVLVSVVFEVAVLSLTIDRVAVSVSGTVYSFVAPPFEDVLVSIPFDSQLHFRSWQL